MCPFLADWVLKNAHRYVARACTALVRSGVYGNQLKVRGHCGNPRIGVSFDDPIIITKKSQRFKFNI
jgi:hypothetical protein